MLRKMVLSMMRNAFMFILTFILIGCGVPQGDDKINYELDAASFNNDYLMMVEKKTGIKLPDGSRGMNMYYKGAPMDPYFMAKIEIPKSEYESLLRELNKISGIKDGSIDSSYMKKESWWNPVKETIKVEKIFGHEMCVVQVLLCNEKGKSVLYVLWMVI